MYMKVMLNSFDHLSGPTVENLTHAQSQSSQKLSDSYWLIVISILIKDQFQCNKLTRNSVTYPTKSIQK